MSDLLPCPFCGGEAEMRVSRAGAQWSGTVVCLNKKCWIYLGDIGRTEETAERNAAKKWNRRKP